MKVNLHCNPNIPPMAWQEFLREAPPRSIALDGYVVGPPKFNARRAVMNANHHEGVDRFSTRCTAAQLALQIRTGLFQAFSGNQPLNVFFNDCDQDVCLSLWLLQHGMIARNIVNPILNRIIQVEDMLDTTAGAYGFPPDMPGLMENNWIFQPYASARINGALSRRDPEEFLQIIYAVGARIDQTIAGNGDKLPLDTRYTLKSRNNVWALVQEVGLNSRAGMFADGITAFVSYQSRADGRMKYSIGRAGIWIPFDILRILERLNELEDDPINKWGGGDTIAGSPRASGSKLTLGQVTDAIEEIVQRSSGKVAQVCEV